MEDQNFKYVAVEAFSDSDIVEEEYVKEYVQENRLFSRETAPRKLINIDGYKPLYAIKSDRSIYIYAWGSERSKQGTTIWHGFLLTGSVQNPVVIDTTWSYDEGKVQSWLDAVYVANEL
jgi:hypothetical protein